MGTLILLHDRLSQTILFFALICALWGFWRYFRREGVRGDFWGALLILEAVILIQGLLGFVLVWMRLQPVRGGIHFLYGVALALALPLVYVYTRSQDGRREQLIYSIVLAIMVGLALRAISTGG
jgi:heme A synthase